MKSEWKYIFGPVPSRRLGRSLGVDLTPLKTCTLDCVFCQLGRTSRKTLERGDLAPVPQVETELARWFREGGTADAVTLSGSGEPTLHSGFGRILKFIKKELPFPAVLLSNGTLFHRPEVREAALSADIVKLSLSAWDADSFRQVNRPHEKLDFDRCVEGMRAFRREFSGKLWLEVFLVKGMNSHPEDVKKIVPIADSIAPDEIHFNTAVRPPAESFVTAVERTAMRELADLFRPRATIVAGRLYSRDATTGVNEDRLLDLLRRRPCTTRQMGGAFGLHVNEVSKYIGNLLQARRIRPERRAGDVYYIACAGGDRDRNRSGETVEATNRRWVE